MLIEFLYQQTHIYLLNSRLFSTSIATILAFILAMVLFPPFIALLRKFNFSSEFQNGEAKSEPVMPAGLLFMAIIWVTCLIAARFNSFIISCLSIYTFFGLIGAADDIAKVANKRKLALGLITKQDYQYKADGISASLRLFLYIAISCVVAILAYKYIPNINGHINLPFFAITKHFPYMPFWLFIPLMTLTIAVMANGVNFTDGYDTLASVPLITCLLFVGVIAYISSNATWSSYLLIPYIRGLDEILPLVGATIGVLLAFLWYNAPPSTIIMGDSGAIGLGGMIGIMFVLTKAIFFLPIVGFIFLLEFMSDVIQIGSFKLTKKRVFRMAPIHHHFFLTMKSNPFYKNDFFIKAKITWRFHIISVIALVLGLILFLKVR